MNEEDFPIINNNPTIVYADHATYTSKPFYVIDQINHYLFQDDFSIKRSMYVQAEKSTELYQDNLNYLASFLGIKISEFYFFSSASFFSFFLIPFLKNKNYSILVCSDMHRSVLDCVKDYNNLFFMDNKGDFNYDQLENILKNHSIDVLFFPFVSHNLGYKIDLIRITELKKKYAKDSILIIDAAQGMLFFDQKLEDTDVDIFFFSSYKLYSLSGIAPVFIKNTILEQLSPEFTESLNMIQKASPNGLAIHSLKHAIMYIEQKKDQIKEIANFTQSLYQELKQIKNIELISSKNSPFIISFFHKHIHSHDLQEKLSDFNILVRSGFLCSEYFHTRLNIKPVVRFSFGLLNKKDDITTIKEVIKNIDSWYS